MNINIGKKIYTLRTNKGYTQEQLARLCTVSSAAISKWENNLSYPDISMLPLLARIFNISIDELLNFEQELDIAQIDTFIKELIEKFSSLSFEEAMTYCKNLIHTYPNSEMLKLKVAGSRGFVAMSLYESQHAQEYIDKFDVYVKELCLSISKSSDLQIAQGACIFLSTFYADDDAQEALDLLQEIPKLTNTTSIESSLYLQLKQNDKAIHVLQNQLYSDFTQVYSNLFSLINLSFIEKDKKKAKELLYIMEELHTILPINSSFYTQSFLFYARLEDKENTLRLLKSYLYNLKNFDTMFTQMKETLKTNPCFSSVELKENTHGNPYTSDIIKNMLNEFKDLSFLHEDNEYKELLQSL